MARPRAALWAAAALLPFSAHLARLIGHPDYYFDGETQIPATIGRELLHGHLGDLFHYQIILYQGSLVWDALLCALGYAVFGDSLLAWHIVPLLSVLGLSFAGSLLLDRTAGPLAAGLFPLLLAVQPFLAKDGFVSGIGGHAPGAFYAVAALALAVHVTEEPKTHGRALLAGLVLAFAAWYVRTAVLALPALVVAARAGGRRALLALALGLLLLPVLIGGNAVIQQRLGSHATARGDWPQVLAGVAWNVQGTPAERVPVGRKLAEASGLGVRTLLYAQPAPPGGEPPYGASNYYGGLVWSAGWTAVLLGVPIALVFERRRAPRATRSGPVWVLAATYAIAYAGSRLNLDPGLVEALRSYPPIPPGVSGGRYLVPIFAALTLLAAQGIGALARLVHPAVGLAASLPLLAVGGALTARDLLAEGDRTGRWRDMVPHQYVGAFGPFRGPPLEVHLACVDPDEESRAAHREAIGRFLTLRPAELAGDPGEPGRRLGQLEARGFRGPELREIAVGLGADLASFVGESGLGELVPLAYRVADSMDPRLAEPYLGGFRDGLGLQAVRGEPGALLDLLCAPTSRGSRPLCGLLGEALVDVDRREVPERPELLFAAGLPPWSELEPEVRWRLLGGAAAQWLSSGTRVVLDPEALAGWDEQARETFTASWRARGGAIRASAGVGP